MMARIHLVSKLGFDRVAPNSNTIGRAVWSDHRIRPYVRLASGAPVSGPAEHELHDAFDAACLADDEFLLAGDLGDGLPDEVA